MPPVPRDHKSRSGAASSGSTPGPNSRCPICNRPAAAASNPFCSPRCAEVDLGRWLTGHYVVPGPAAEEDDDQPPEPDRLA